MHAAFAKKKHRHPVLQSVFSFTTDCSLTRAHCNFWLLDSAWVQVRDEARARVRVGGCDVALVLRCVLCGLSFHRSMFQLAKGFIVGSEVRKK